MQEYCYKSTRKEATRALFKVVANNFKDKKFFKKSTFQKRYLPHDPQMILEQTLNETLVEQPMKVEDLNFPPNLQNLENNEICSSGFHSVSSNSPTIQTDDFKERQTQFNSILRTIEKENCAVLERLTSLQNSTRDKKLQKEDNEVLPIDNCVTMQAQLNRLKLLMEGLFEFQEGEEGCETPLR